MNNDTLLKPEAHCFLNVLGRHFLVEIKSVENKNIHVTFPGKDYPLEGMNADLEFHDMEGITSYHAQVVMGPTQIGDGVLLERTPGYKRNQHRESWRVPVDLPVKLKAFGRPEVNEGRLVNINSGGVLIRTDIKLVIGDKLEMTFTLPGRPPHTIFGDVVYVNVAENDAVNAAHHYGVKFSELTPLAARSVTIFLWKRIRELYPEKLRNLYPQGKDF